MDSLTRASVMGYFEMVNSLLDGMWKKAEKGDGGAVRKYLKDVVKYMEKVPPRAAAVSTEHMKLREACSQTADLIDICQQERRDPSDREVKRHFGAIRKAQTKWLESLEALVSP